MLITFEGVDKSGKTTLIQRLMELLEEQGIDAVTFHEPGSTPAAEEIRNTIFNHDLDPLTEAMLFFAARRELWLNEIVPALEDDKVVILDRFFDSTFAYQHHGRGLDWDTINKLKNMTVGGVKPNYTFILHIDLATMKARGLSDDRFDQESEEFLSNVIDGYRIMADSHGRFHLLDGKKDVDTVFLQIAQALETQLGLDIADLLPVEEAPDDEIGEDLPADDEEVGADEEIE